MASKRCSSIKLLSLMFVSKSISKSLLINDILLHYCDNIKSHRSDGDTMPLRISECRQKLNGNFQYPCILFERT